MKPEPQPAFEERQRAAPGIVARVGALRMGPECQARLPP